MRIYSNYNKKTCHPRTATDRVLAQVLRALRANGGVDVRRSTTDASCGVPVRPQVRDCKLPCSDPLLSCETAEAQNSANRTAYYAPSIAALAVGDTSAPAVFQTVPAIGALDFLGLTGRSRTVYLTDLVSTLASLDAMLVIVSVGGVARFTLNGGRFARANANSSTQACGLWVCAGALETVTIQVFNQSGAAFGAADTARFETRTVFAGEDGYMCQACTPAPCECTAAPEDDGASMGFDPGEVG